MISGVVLVEPDVTWPTRELLPGGHVIVITASEKTALDGRNEGLELRDSIVIISPGPSLRYAFVFRKPLAERNVAEQILATGTGGLDITACRAGGRWPTNLILIHAKDCAVQCGSTCPVPALDRQSGERRATLTGKADPNVVHENPGDNNGASWFGGGNSQVYADSGGAARYYVQVADEIALEDWFRRLIA